MGVNKDRMVIDSITIEAQMEEQEYEVIGESGCDQLFEELFLRNQLNFIWIN